MSEETAVAVEKVAEAIWQAEAKRALGRRLVGWDDVAEEDKGRYRFTAREVLTALAQPQLRDAGEGWVLVPKEPTEEMILGAAHYLRIDSVTNIRAAWDTMLTEAPSPSDPKEDKSR